MTLRFSSISAIITDLPVSIPTGLSSEIGVSNLSISMTTGSAAVDIASFAAGHYLESKDSEWKQLQNPHPPYHSGSHPARAICSRKYEVPSRSDRQVRPCRASAPDAQRTASVSERCRPHHPLNV